MKSQDRYELRYVVNSIEIVNWSTQSRKVINATNNIAVTFGWYPRFNIKSGDIDIWAFTSGNDKRSNTIYFDLAMLFTFGIPKRKEKIITAESNMAVVSNELILILLDNVYSTIRGILFEKYSRKDKERFILPALSPLYIMESLRIENFDADRYYRTFRQNHRTEFR